MHAKSTFSDEHFEYIHVSYVLLKGVTLCRFCKPRHQKTSVLDTFSMISVHLCMKPAYARKTQSSQWMHGTKAAYARKTRKTRKILASTWWSPGISQKLLSFLSFSSICRVRAVHPLRSLSFSSICRFCATNPLTKRGQETTSVNFAKWPERPLCEVKAGLPGHFAKLRFVAF